MGMHLSNTFSSLESSDNNENAVSEQNCYSCTGQRTTTQSQKALKAERQSQKNRASLVDNAQAIAELLPSCISQSRLDS